MSSSRAIAACRNGGLNVTISRNVDSPIAALRIRARQLTSSSKSTWGDSPLGLFAQATQNLQDLLGHSRQINQEGAE